MDLIADPHNFLVFIHVTLMAYWLGGDLGVYMTADKVADPNLPLDERLRLLKLLLNMDMAPRTALILMLPTGFQMATNVGAIDASPLNVYHVWAFSLIWLTLAWTVHIKEHAEFGELIRKIDLGVRYIMIAIIAIWVGVSTEGNGPLYGDWMIAKLSFFGGIICIGLLLRLEVGKWVTGFAMLREGKEIDAANALITKTRRRASIQARILWGFILIMAYLGVTQVI